jgi:hypothetical protein
VLVFFTRRTEVAMLATLLLAAVSSIPGVQDKKADDNAPPSKMELFSREDWYKNQTGKEQDFTGKLSKVERKSGAGFSRFNAYRLEAIVHKAVTVQVKVGEKVIEEKRLVPETIVLEVYVGGKANILDAYVGRSVKLVGKPVTLEVEGTKYNEVWPARVELWDPKKIEVKGPPRGADNDEACCADEKDAQDAKLLKIQASAPIPLTTKEGHVVIRSAKELLMAQASKDKGEEAEKAATAKLAEALKLDAIDWSKQMVICIDGGTRPTGGYSVDVISATVQNNKLTIYWKLTTPKAGEPVTQVVTHPQRTIVVDRYEGPVDFNPATAPGAVKKESK